MPEEIKSRADKLPDKLPPPATTTLVGKLAEVMQAVGRIPKRGKNQSQGYAYVTEADVADTVRDELARRGVVLVPSVKSLSWRTIEGRSGPLHVATVLMTFTFRDDGGQIIEYDMLGEGMDSGDKNVFKAMTGAEKYALLKFFLIPTGDDPEKDDEKKDEPEQPRTRKERVVAAAEKSRPAGAEHKAPSGDKLTDQMRRDLWDAVRVQWPDDADKQKAIITELCKAHGVEKSADLPLAQSPGNPEGYWHLLAWLDGRKAKEKA